MNWKIKLKQAGYRISNPRCVVMDVFNNSSIPMEPKEILAKARATGHLIGLVSVYRSLDLLSKLGIVRLVHLEDGSQGYVVASEGHHHHIVCKVCGQVMEFSGLNDLGDLLARVELETGFEVSDHLLQLYGLCPECRKSKVSAIQ